MAVYTQIDIDSARPLFDWLGLGELRSLRGIPSGIENTNYFADTPRGEFVLTLFERLGPEQLPYYLHLMKHLASRGIPVPEPVADSRGELLFELAGKPAAVVTKLRGSVELSPTPHHCALVGAMLAKMHLAGIGFDRKQANLRGGDWMRRTVPEVLPHLDAECCAILKSELLFQTALEGDDAYRRLPAGPVHADLFRDNVMFDGGELGGFFDFYFAGDDTFLFDLAVCLNDWCVDLATGCFDEPRRIAFLDAYRGVRPLEAAERIMYPKLLRRAALRFWLSRLWDWHLPRPAALLKPHDPAHFERILVLRRNQDCQIY
jgi:homoserine kinase type II